MYNSIKLRDKLIQAGYKYLRLCDTESTNPEIQHYTLEKSLEVDSDSCMINSFVDMESEEGMQILDRFLNPIVIHPNPLEV